MAAAFRRLFCSSGKVKPPESDGTSASKTESPARRLRHGLHRDQVQPISMATESSRKFVGFFKPKKVNSASVSSPVKAFDESKQPAIGHQQKVRARRLMKELKEAQRLEQNNPVDPPFTVELVNDNLFEWHVKLYRIDLESDLAADMRELKVKYILLHVTFPENFPFAPPFIRVISPKIDKGFVMEGGAICMELLTPRGWASAYTLEAVVMQFAASLVKGQVRGDRGERRSNCELINYPIVDKCVDSFDASEGMYQFKRAYTELPEYFYTKGRIARKTKSSKNFSQRTAEESFRSLVKTHDKYGWVTPPLADG